MKLKFIFALILLVFSVFSYCEDKSVDELNPKNLKKNLPKDFNFL